VPWMEVVVAFFLILGLRARSAALILCIQLLAFILAISSVLYRRMDVTCSCFGEYEPFCKGPIGVCHIGQDVAFLIAALIILLRGPGMFSMDAILARPKAARTA
jgi:uncharacterized membrane protein YphA (DoxX/SURF4 family)